MNKQPVRLRIATNEVIGTTAFFRNRILLNTLLNELLAASDNDDIKVLFHGCSIGAEVYAFVMAYNVLRDRLPPLFVYATDIEPQFIDFAKSAVYPKDIVHGLEEHEKKLFDAIDDDNLIVTPQIREQVNFLPPSNYLDFESTENFDLVFLLNTLLYVTEEQQARSISNVASYNSHWLVTSGFHAATIKRDLVDHGYRPFTKNIEAIHDAWIDRRVIAHPPEIAPEFPPGSYADWRLPDFTEIEDFEYKYCALFEKVL